MEYISKNNAKTFKSKTTTQREYYTPSKRPNFSMILPKSSNFWVYFPDSNIDQDNYDDEIENEENSKKIKLKKSTVKKIFDMQGIPFKNIIPYIEFSFSYVKSETVTNTITTFNIEYKTIMKIIDNFYIQFGNEEDIEINK